jgi:tetratricopeptide (TPR) repeat protein
MTQTDNTEVAEKAFAQALAALATDDTLTALPHLERALKHGDRAGWHSYLGYCIARERGQQRKGLEYCLHSLAAEPDNPDHFLNLGRVYLLGGEKDEALRVTREGMAKGGSPQLAELLERLGSRRPPLFPSLSRSNPINKYLGMLLGRLGLR